MKFWIASFVLLFGLAELYQWVQHFTFPLPVFILGGTFLAIASNHDKRVGFPGQRPLTGTPPIASTPVLSTPTPSPTDARRSPPARATSPFDQYATGASVVDTEAAGEQSAQSPTARSISFTIDPSKH